ncbi:hypothetical protein [Bradyrhizobium sp. ORS 111]|uniref:hypothetical protein n=1 Tax=Bradyrhizobium sp. ORS 111 TaxID=1685958 RepID=UPI0038902961
MTVPGKLDPRASAFPRPSRCFLPAERSLLVAHLAQVGPHGLELGDLYVVDRWMMRQADCLMFFVAENAAFELARDRHYHPPFDFLNLGQKDTFSSR